MTVLRRGSAKYTAKQWKTFLDYLAKSANVYRSAATAGMSGTKLAYERKRNDPDFADQWEAALDVGRGNLIATLWKLGVEGTMKTVSLGQGMKTQDRVWDSGVLRQLASFHIPEWREMNAPQQATPQVVPPELTPDAPETGDEPGPEKPVV